MYTKYPKTVKAGMEHHFITQDLVDELTNVLLTHPKFHKLAEEYASKEVTSALQEYGYSGCETADIEKALNRPISQTELGCDYYNKWFAGLLNAYLTKQGPYPVEFDREVVIV